MPDVATILRAAPIGLLMLVGTYVAARRRKTGWARARDEYPLLARRLGLEHKAPRSPASIGALKGRFRGFEVFVDPDERPRVVVYFAARPALVLRTFAHEKRTPPGMDRLQAGSAVLNAFFPDRYAAPALAAALAVREDELTLRLLPFAKRWEPRLLDLTLTSERLECALRIVRPSHIPADVVEGLLSDAVELARVVEAADSAGIRPPVDPPRVSD